MSGLISPQIRVKMGPQANSKRRDFLDVPTNGKALVLAREEAFAVLIADGMGALEARARSGWPASAPNAAALLARPNIRARIEALLEARRKTGALSLEEITSMLQRVYAGALHDGEYGAAHNAAFSLARLYGLVVDRAQVDVVRRPTRDPDAPSEQALGAWLEALPSKPMITLDNPPQPQGPGLEAEARASSLEAEKPNEIDGLPGLEPWGSSGFSGDRANPLKSLGFQGPGPAGRSENGAPDVAVTGTPHTRARAHLQGHRTDMGSKSQPPRAQEKRVPPPKKQVPVKSGAKPVLPKSPKKPLSGAAKRKARQMKELFG